MAGVGTNRYSDSFNDPVNKFDPGGNETKADDGSSWPDEDDSDACESQGSCRGQDAIDSALQAARDDPLGTAGSIAYELSPVGAVNNIISGVMEGNAAQVGLGIVEITPWGKLGTKAIKVMANGAEETTTLFRAVRPEEYNEVMETGAFRMGQGSMELGKQFGLNIDETLKFADSYPDIAGIVRVEVPTKTLDAIADRTHVDPFIFKSGTVTIPAEDLSTFNRCLICISDALE